ncbi:MAG: DUF1802 family protein [Planctomycetes bacterium]|jgi:hypothetical protein|nr:DUF1802 family protein [Planctomycetota bacterium]
MLDLALKEWAIVCDLLVEGRCALVLRKGGVHEEGGPGRFKLEHERFALFPAWEHERLDWIKPAFRLREAPIEDEPAQIELRGYAEVGRIWEVPSREAFDALDDLHPWTAEQIDMRFNYKPERPLFLLALRAYQLSEAKVIPNRPSFAGCRSWVPLPPEDAVDETGATPAMSDDRFADVLRRVDAAFGA